MVPFTNLNAFVTWFKEQRNKERVLFFYKTFCPYCKPILQIIDSWPHEEIPIVHIVMDNIDKMEMKKAFSETRIDGGGTLDKLMWKNQDSWTVPTFVFARFGKEDDILFARRWQVSSTEERTAAAYTAWVLSQKVTTTGSGAPRGGCTATQNLEKLLSSHIQANQPLYCIFYDSRASDMNCERHQAVVAVLEQNPQLLDHAAWSDLSTSATTLIDSSTPQILDMRRGYGDGENFMDNTDRCKISTRDMTNFLESLVQLS